MEHSKLKKIGNLYTSLYFFFLFIIVNIPAISVQMQYVQNVAKENGRIHIIKKNFYESVIIAIKIFYITK